MTPAEQKEKLKGLVRYLLRIYPECATESSNDHAEFVDDMSDILLSISVQFDEGVN